MAERRKTVLVAGVPLGAWLLVAPFFVFEAMFAPNFWNDMLVGVTVLGVATYDLVGALRGRPASVVAGGLIALLGVWQMVRPNVVGTAGSLPFWSDVTVGLLLAFLGGRAMREARTVGRAAEDRIGGR